MNVNQLAKNATRREIVFGLRAHDSEVQRDIARREAEKMLERAACLLARANHDTLANRALELLQDVEGRA